MRHVHAENLMLPEVCFGAATNYYLYYCYYLLISCRLFKIIPGTGYVSMVYSVAGIL
jgi:hypothetical protein